MKFVFKEHFIKAALIEAKRLNLSQKELQEIKKRGLQSDL